MPLAPDSDILLSGVVELPEVLDLKAATQLAVEFLTLRGRPVINQAISKCTFTRRI
jgi:hypothetical protein